MPTSKKVRQAYVGIAHSKHYAALVAREWMLLYRSASWSALPGSIPVLCIRSQQRKSGVMLPSQSDVGICCCIQLQGWLREQKY